MSACMPSFLIRKSQFSRVGTKQRPTSRTNSNRETTHVGISISGAFFYSGERKRDNWVTYMPRRGFPLVRTCMRKNKGLAFLPIDGVTEREVAARLKNSGIFLATALGEEFGLPALEAMAGGCLVLSVPVKGGMEYLDSGESCLVVKPEKLGEKLKWITRPEHAALRSQMRSKAVAIAARYRAGLQRTHLESLLSHELKWLVS